MQAIEHNGKLAIAVASGKGGAGKTFVASNLAYVASKTARVKLYDLDVEEPNCHLFLSMPESRGADVNMMIPVVNDDICSNCGVCGQICEFHAIIPLADTVMVFPELCHSCYGCLEMCPEGAITAGEKTIGRLSVSSKQDSGPADSGLTLITGKLKIGEHATTAMIKETRLTESGPSEIDIYDSPPGTSCPVIEAVHDVDYIILVSEPNPFGLHDLDLVVQTVRQLGKRFGVVLNKADEGNNIIEDYCRDQGIEILGRIPQRRDIALATGSGALISETMPGMAEMFCGLLERVRSRVAGEDSLAGESPVAQQSLAAQQSPAVQTSPVAAPVEGGVK